MDLKAVIFDLNGTVLSDEDEYGAAFRIVLAKLGKKVNMRFPHIRGIGVKENWPRLLAKYHIKTNKTLEELEQETQATYIEMLHKVDTRKGFKEFASKLKKDGIKTALATSNSYFIVERIFDELNLSGYFDIVTTSDEVAFNKPSPEIYQVTADKLGIDPAYSLVIEDSEAGIEAAKSAGMKAVGITKGSDAKNNFKMADLVISDFRNLSSKLESL